VTQTYVPTALDYTILCGPNNNNTITFNMPAAAANLGRIYVFKRTDPGSGVCTINGVDTAVSISLDNPGGTSANSPSGITVQSDGTTWWVIAVAP
jgi:hypothetical protein